MQVTSTERVFGYIPLLGYDQAEELLGRPQLGDMVMSQEDGQKDGLAMGYTKCPPQPVVECMTLC